MALPLNLDELLSGGTVEWDRLEFKEGWNPEAILHSLCAFANDLNNWGGGYIIVGIGAADGRPTLPPLGLNPAELDACQQKLRELTHKIEPFYAPVSQPVVFQGKHILVIWAYGGEMRPYKAPTTLSEKGQKRYYIRRGSVTAAANPTEERQLLDLTRSIPFDDRINAEATLADLNLGLIREFLQEIGSPLFDEALSLDFSELCRTMQIVRGPSEYLRPLNVGLLFFCDHPQKLFRYARIEVVIFEDEADRKFSEKIFAGPIHRQLRDALRHIDTQIIFERVEKRDDRPESDRFFNYPFAALAEALANAVYHSAYEPSNPIVVSVFPDRIEIANVPGPVPPITAEDLKKPRVTPYTYRNRRIGDFLKELELTEGRSTGIPRIRRAMERNGSPEPLFETDADRTYFLTVLKVHPKLVGVKPHLLERREVGVIDGREDSREDGTESSENRILKVCLHPKSRTEILTEIGLTDYDKNFERHVRPLLTAGWLEMTLPDKPTSRHQRYRTTAKGKRKLKR